MYTPRFVAPGVVDLLDYAPLGNLDWFGPFTCRAILSTKVPELSLRGRSMLDSSVVIGASTHVIAIAALQLSYITPEPS